MALDALVATDTTFLIATDLRWSRPPPQGRRLAAEWRLALVARLASSAAVLTDDDDFRSDALDFRSDAFEFSSDALALRAEVVPAVALAAVTDGRGAAKRENGPGSRGGTAISDGSSIRLGAKEGTASADATHCHRCEMDEGPSLDR